jgi:diguanylate cyclase (GGDEF)-like protein
MTEMSRFQARLLQVVRRWGAWPVVAAITGVSVTASVTLTGASLAVDPPERSIVVFAMVTSVLIPLVVAPAASLLVVRLVGSLSAAYDELELRATTDALTGLRNRRGFFADIDARYAARRPGDLVIAGMIDLDDLKVLNDAHGHHAGDAVLAELGARLAAAVAGRAATGRLGGDEFAVFCTATHDEAATLSRALHDAVASFEAVGRIATASIGLAVVSDDTPPDVALRTADANLYERKRLRGVRTATR